jgi:formate transporter
VITVVPPIAAFAAAWFEHSIANMYFIPTGLFIKAGAPDSFWKAIGQDAGGLSGVDLEQFILWEIFFQ